MERFVNHLKLWLTGAIVALLTAVPVFAEDTVTLKSGEVLRGEIVQESDAFVVLRIEIGDLEQRKILVMGEIESIVRDAASRDTNDNTSARDDARPVRGDRRASAPRSGDGAIPRGTTGVAFVRLGDSNRNRDMVGPYLNGKAIQRSTEILRELPDDQQPSIVVLEIDSGGGAVAELEDIIYAIQEDLKRDYRVVAWIRNAISGAAFTAMNCEEIVFMSSGRLGGNVAFDPSTMQAAEGAFLDQMLEYGTQVANNGRIDPKVMHAMQIFMTLSCDIDDSGRVTWYDTDQGEFLVSPQDEILTLNAIDAEKFGISLGIADTREELMGILGVEEWVVVGEKADEFQEEWRDNVWTADARSQELFSKMQIALDLARGAQSERQLGVQLNKARRYLGTLRGLVRRADSLERYGQLPPQTMEIQGLSREWFRYWEEQIDDIADRR